MELAAMTEVKGMRLERNNSTKTKENRNPLVCILLLLIELQQLPAPEFTIHPYYVNALIKRFFGKTVQFYAHACCLKLVSQRAPGFTG